VKIGLVTTSFPRGHGDGAGGFVAGHAAYLGATGATVDVIAAGDPLGDPSGPPDDHVTRVRAPRGLFYAGGAPDALEARPRALAGALGFSARMLATVARRARGWDAACAHWLAPSAIAAAIATRRIPLLAIAHGGDVHLLDRARLLAPALALLDARGAQLAFVSDDLRRRALDAVPRVLAARIARRARVQPMGVDDGRAAEIAAARASRRPRGDDEPADLLVLARLAPIKAVDVAIDALAHLRTPARLVIAGDGPERARLEAAARPHGERITFAGWVDADRRDALLVAADAVLVPSAPRPDGRSEGTPLAALEALAAGVPVIASAIGGLPELVAHGARVVPPRDPRALAAAVDAALAAAAPRPAALGWQTAGAALDHHWRRGA